MAQATGGVYVAANLLSDGYVPAAYTDSAFVDPWGVSGGKTLWIDTAVTGYSYVVPIATVTATPPTASSAVSFKSTVPAAPGITGPGQPTGTVQNADAATTDFVLPNGSKATFFFATLDGTISGWNGLQTAPTYTAQIVVNNSASKAVYTDMAQLNNTTTSQYYLLAANFGQGASVEVYNKSFQKVSLAGSFTDPSVPTGYAPYAVKVIGTQVYVAYMLRNSTFQETLGTNTGFVSVFDMNGNYVARAVTGGLLNAPWGIAIAPAGFGIYSGDLLIGNFGDGLITAYNPTTFAYLGVIADQNGKAIAYPGLWAIFGNTGGTVPGALYFTAGLAQETHGLLGSITNSTTATSTPTFNLSTSTTVPAAVLPGEYTNLTLSIAPVNSFAGSVALSCSGLPAGATCNFSLPQVAVTGTAPATQQISLQAAPPSYGQMLFHRIGGNTGLNVASALLLPFGSLLVLRRRKGLAAMRALGAFVLLIGSTGLMMGCSNGYSPTATGGTPAGTSKVTITATSGAISQSTVVTFTVQ
jgi:uncharacterized protein (TIGR03118 family)